MIKYFVASDIHSFFTIFKKSLEEKGFDTNNPEHYLIICGDIFDRGTEPVELYNFLLSLGNRFIFIRGNHEDLLFDCVGQLERGEDVSYHHISNGTLSTIDKFLFYQYGFNKYFNYREELYDEFYLNKSIKPLINLYKPIHKILNWIEEKSINYYEKGDYIFTHGWIPEGPLWRDSSIDKWREARWLNGIKECCLNNKKEPNKIIVCGHYHCSWGWAKIKKQLEEFPSKKFKGWEESFKPYIDEGIIAIDACTAYSNKINILVFEENNNKLDMIF